MSKIKEKDLTREKAMQVFLDIIKESNCNQACKIVSNLAWLNFVMWGDYKWYIGKNVIYLVDSVYDRVPLNNIDFLYDIHIENGYFCIEGGKI